MRIGFGLGLGGHDELLEALFGLVEAGGDDGDADLVVHGFVDGGAEDDVGVWVCG